MYFMLNIVVCVVCVVGIVIVCGFEKYNEVVIEFKGLNDFVI